MKKCENKDPKDQIVIEMTCKDQIEKIFDKYTS